MNHHHRVDPRIGYANRKRFELDYFELDYQ